MSLDNFIPEIWSARLLERLQKSLVYGAPGVINRDYEGEIRQAGDTVRINSIGPVTVTDYTKNTDHAAPETLSDAGSTLQITKAKMFAFQVDDVDRAQQTPKVMDGAMTEAAYALRDAADQFIASLWAEMDTANFIGTDGSPKQDLETALFPYNYLVDLGVLLDEDNVPAEGRWAIVPPWFHGYLLKDSRFVAAGTPTSDAVIRNGVIGDAAGFRILKSNNVVNTANASYKIIAGHPIGWSYAEQVNKVEGYRPERRFADALKGLHLYGAKVTRASAFAVLHADPT